MLPTRNRRHRILGLALDPPYIDGWVECCLERIGEDDSKEEEIFRDLWDDETQREVIIDCLKADCESGRGDLLGVFFAMYPERRPLCGGPLHLGPRVLRPHRI